MSNLDATANKNFAELSQSLAPIAPRLRKKPVLHAALSLALAGIFSSPVLAEDNTVIQQYFDISNDCLPESITDRPANLFSNPQTELNTNLLASPITINADRLHQTDKQEFLLEGAIELQHPQVRIYADELLLNSEQRQATLKHGVRLLQKNLSLLTEEIVIQPQHLKIAANRYQILPSRAYGDSSSIELDQAKQYAELHDASLTTCKLKDDGDKDWELTAGKMIIDQQEQRVIAKNTVLRFKDVPIFYSPYLNYPLNDRASGLLFPEIGSYKALNNQRRTEYAALPYYFALAPNYDDTLTVIPMTDGLALDNEFRYWGYLGTTEQRLTLDTSLYHNNSPDNQEDNPRWRVGLQDAIRFTPKFSANIDWQQTSDPNVFNDAPIEKTYLNATKATQMARLDYRHQNAHAYLLYSGYQELINFENNYEKRPEAGLNLQQSLFKDQIPGKASWYFQTQATDFRLKTSDLNRAEGLRWHNKAGINYRLRKPYAFAQAQANAYYTDYQLDEGAVTSEQRFIPQLAVSGGLIFERPFQFSQSKYRQTLEPTVQYLYTGYRQQNQLPLFDSALRSLDFGNLFALNPYVGADRIADSNQISAALTSRFIDEKGKSRLELAIGQSYRLSDSEVLLEDGFDGSQGASDIYSKAQFNFDKLRIYSTIAFDPQEQSIRASANRIRWQPNERNALFASHIKQRQEALYASETVMLGALSQVHQNWQLNVIGNYDTELKQWVDSQIGVRYDSCCWSTTIIAERTQLENDLYNDSIRFQFELKGLSTPNNTLQKLDNLFNF
ncbi:LPS-assembly protein LptD [Thiomicrorhabdus sp. 6S2-11]|uniref:LPS-assembly protein LptD n=1 Tax=Thiomicrorhabdus marina TaxID=2818442 RepID=A0ABS3Q1M7_9GAMM|nr:LPS assembly protein LptD [Thiomicrorhabdus marina]MBO1926219.1 LPS-assembly protein LptD [Thiomicrorhabdus marina]